MQLRGSPFALLLLASLIVSKSVANSGVAPNMSDPFRGFDITRIALGSACSANLAAVDSLPCQPALLSAQPSRKFAGNLLIGNEYSKIYNYSKLVDDGQRSEVVQEILTQGRPLELNGAAQLWFRSSNVALSFVPAAVSYFSYVQNSAYPSLQVQAMLERSLSAQFSSYVGEDFYLGLQLRGVDRTFVQDRFDFYEYLARPNDYLKTQRQRALYVEPAVAYVHSSAWKPRATAMLSNIGWTDQKHQALAMSPIATTALGISPPLEGMNLDLSLAYRLSDRFSGEERGFAFGTHFQVGLLSATFGFSQQNTSAGLHSIYKKVRVGLLYQRTTYTGLEERGDSVHAEFGVQL